jgi:hypothetical protein
MSRWVEGPEPGGPEEEGGPDFGADDLPDEEEVPSKEGLRGAADVDGFDDVPTTRLSDEEYDEFVASEFDAKGREKGAPPVTAILIGVTVLIVVLWLLLGR